MLHIAEQAQDVEGVLQGVVLLGVHPACIKGVFARVDCDKPKLF